MNKGFDSTVQRTLGDKVFAEVLIHQTRRVPHLLVR